MKLIFFCGAVNPFSSTFAPLQTSHVRSLNHYLLCHKLKSGVSPRSSEQGTQFYLNVLAKSVRYVINQQSSSTVCLLVFESYSSLKFKKKKKKSIAQKELIMSDTTAGMQLLLQRA